MTKCSQLPEDGKEDDVSDFDFSKFLRFLIYEIKFSSFSFPVMIQKLHF